MMVFRFPGVLEDDPPEAARLWELGCRGMQQQGDEIAAWFGGEVDLPFAGRWETERDVDWVAAYQASLDPVVLHRIVVAPTHATVTLTAGQQVIWLDPSMAFGTGHHATTRMALERLEARVLHGLRVLDVGAGSGILAIAAARLGAAAAHGVDTDEATVPLARAVARANGAHATFEHGSLRPGDPAHACDVLVANLYAELHVELASSFARALMPGGGLIVTGILVERAPKVEAALAGAGFARVTRFEDGAWCLLEGWRP